VNRTHLSGSQTTQSPLGASSALQTETVNLGALFVAPAIGMLLCVHKLKPMKVLRGGIKVSLTSLVAF